MTENVNIEKVNSYYGWLTDMANKGHHGSENVTVGWKTKEQQDRRFEKLLEIGVKSGDSVLDFGCGLSELFNYTKNKGLYIKYMGIDINSKFLETSNQKYREFSNFKTQQIKSIEDIKGRYDWCLVSGTFNYGHYFEDIIEELHFLYKISNKGISFNLLSEKPLKEHDPDEEGIPFYVAKARLIEKQKLWKTKGGLIMFEPEKFQDLMKNKYGNSKMSKDYLDSSSGSEFNDFTIYIYKS